MEISSALIALIGTLFGGAGFKVLEHFLTKRQIKDTTASNIRTELRADIDRRDEEIIRKEDQLKYYREELAKAELENDKLRDSYYQLREEFYEAKRELQRELDTLKITTMKAQEAIDRKPSAEAKEL